jgi:hypothetical protein
MFRKKLGIVGAVVIGLGTVGGNLAIGQSQSATRRNATAVPRPLGPPLSPAAELMYNHVKRERPGELNWREGIPWMIDMPDAIRQARAESRPILLWLAGDAPLERC